MRFDICPLYLTEAAQTMQGIQRKSREKVSWGQEGNIKEEDSEQRGRVWLLDPRRPHCLGAFPEGALEFSFQYLKIDLSKWSIIRETPRTQCPWASSPLPSSLHSNDRPHLSDQIVIFLLTTSQPLSITWACQIHTGSHFSDHVARCRDPYSRPDISNFPIPSPLISY